jgi:hypothetical protein
MSRPTCLLRYLGATQGPLGEIGIGPEGELAGILEAHVGGHLIEHFQGGGSALQGERGEQQVVADGVDQTGNPLCPVVDLFQQLWRDSRLVFESGARHPGIHVSHGLVKIEAPQGAPQGNALLELAEFRGIQLAIQFLLAGEDDLKQLATPVLEIS